MAGIGKVTFPDLNIFFQSRKSIWPDPMKKVEVLKSGDKTLAAAALSLDCLFWSRSPVVLNQVSLSDGAHVFFLLPRS